MCFIISLLLLGQMQLQAQLTVDNPPNQTLRLGVFTGLGSGEDTRIILCASNNQARLIINGEAISEGTFRIDIDNNMLIVSFTYSTPTTRISLGTFIFNITNNSSLTGVAGQRWIWLQDEMRFTIMNGGGSEIRGANGHRL